MAKLTKCKACGAEISRAATACPKCGDPQRKRTSGCAWVALAGFVFLAACVVVGSGIPDSQQDSGPAQSSPPPRPTSQQAAQQAAAEAANNERLSVVYSCQRAITAGLNDPDSAEFPDDDSFTVEQAAKGLWEVSFVGRAKNGFGALMVGRGHCEVLRYGPDDYRAVNAVMQ